MAASGQTIIHLPDGPINVNLRENLLHARGIPYATAKRFRSPEPVPSWAEEGTRDCRGSASICPQLPSRLDMVTGPLAKGRTMSEDCTHVTLISPATADNGGALYPVMVFFHGGAYLSGGGDLDCYQGFDLARRGVTVVHVTYRLGVLGYAAIPGVSPPNLGLLDQIAALQWVKRNVAYFNGDAERVTVFGESAGADSIFCLLVAEGTEGLFHRMIMQSAPLGRRYSDESDQLAPVLGDLARARLRKWEEEGTSFSSEDLLAIQTELLITAKKLSPRAMAFAPVFGHYPLPPRSELDKTVLQRARDLPTLIGYTAHEGRAFAEMNDKLQPFFTLPIIGELIRRLISWFITKQVFHWPGDRFFAELIRGGVPCSMYKFNWCPRGGRWGSVHTAELPFLLGSWDAWRGAPMMGGDESKSMFERLGAEMKNMWVAFARGADHGRELIRIDAEFKHRSM